MTPLRTLPPNGQEAKSKRPTTTALGPFGRPTKEPWEPRSLKARLRRHLRSLGLPNPTDKLQAFRLLREHPSWLPPEPTKEEMALKGAYRQLPLSLAELERRTSLQGRLRNLPR